MKEPRNSNVYKNINIYLCQDECYNHERSKIPRHATVVYPLCMYDRCIFHFPSRIFYVLR